MRRDKPVTGRPLILPLPFQKKTTHLLLVRPPSYHPLLGPQLSLSPVPANQAWQQGWDITEEGWDLKARRRALRWQGTGQTHSEIQQERCSFSKGWAGASFSGGKQEAKQSCPAQPGPIPLQRAAPHSGAAAFSQGWHQARPGEAVFSFLSFSLVLDHILLAKWNTLTLVGKKSHLHSSSKRTLKEQSGWSEIVNGISECCKECQKIPKPTQYLSSL